MKMHSAVSGAWRSVTTNSPWYVRIFGMSLLTVDTWWWLGESSPTTILELAKHGMLLAIGLACFAPRVLILVINSARRLPFFDRRSEKRPIP